MSEPALVFVPWVARGGAVDLPPDRPDAHPPNRVTTTAAVEIGQGSAGSPTVQRAQASVNVELLGPGDVTALARQQIIRAEPAPGTAAFESNYLALVEFDEPALPWLFTPASAVAGRLRPWLALVVVAVGPGVVLDPPGAGPLPVLRIGPPALPEVELPDLADSWAWAHAQVAPDGADPVAALAGDPARNLSRLICGRLLAPQTEYLACVVPTFEAGRLAGLGQDPAPASGPAWVRAASMPPVSLPVYWSWRFATGPAGDFQSLALAIRGRPVPAGFGSRPIDLSTAGLGLTGTDDAQLRLGGALRPLDGQPATWSDPALSERFATALADVLNTPDHAPAFTPVLAPPRYGAAYRATPALDPAMERWYEQLNLHPGNRLGAALGVQVVQRDQETLVAAAWDQTADLRAATALDRLGTAGAVLAERLQLRHLAALPPQVGVMVVAPLLARLRADPVIVAAGLAARLSTGAIAHGSFGVAVRRVTRSRGAIARRAAGPAADPGVARPSIAVAARISHLGGVRGPRIDAGSLATVDLLGESTSDVSWAAIDVAAFAAAPPRPRFVVRTFALPAPGGGVVGPGHGGVIVQPGTVLHVDPTVLAARPEIVAEPLLPGTAGTGPGRRLRRPPGDPEVPDPPGPVDPPDPPDPPDRPDNAQAAEFRALGQRHLQAFLAPAATGGTAVVVGVDPAALFHTVIEITAPRLAFSAALAQVLAVPDGGGEPAPAEPVIPAHLTPAFSTPMSGALAELGEEWLLPGIGGVPANTAIALATNSAFVRSFMIGLNHELGRELLWRVFAAPSTATFFQRFWDNATDASAPVDIDPLIEWDERTLAAPAPDERFVILLRTELLRRFPDAVVSAVRAGETRLPSFTGAMSPDVRFFGFAIPAADAAQWSVVIAEQPGAPRFGFEVGDAPAGVSHAPATDATSAALADRLHQLPARITIPVPVLLRRPEEHP